MAIFDIADGKKVFVGPKDDPFFVDLGAIFDLATIRKGLGTDGGGVDGLKGFNVHSIALQIPTKELVKPGGAHHRRLGDHRAPAPDGARRRQGERLRRVGPGLAPGQPAHQRGRHPGRPEGLLERPEPSKDAQFDKYLLNPELAADLNLLYGPSGLFGSIFDPPIATTGRIDLLTVLHTGVGPEVLPTLPALNYTGKVHADMLRLNTSIPPVACGMENRMGVLGGDLAGFPNGRRLADDVTDIELQAIAVKAPLDFLTARSTSSATAWTRTTRPFGCSFPYLAEANQGFSYSHDTTP